VGSAQQAVKDKEEQTFEEEMVDDIISLVTSYSARIYGKRGGKKKKNG
jgi:predicted site-specific integrase-resolvase